MPHFTEIEHPEFKEMKDKWVDAWRHYTGEYAIGSTISQYLQRRQQRETQDAYSERQDMTDPILYFPTAVDGLNGIWSTRQDATRREWGELGDPEEPDSIAYTLKRNADGEGTNWGPLFKQVGIRLTVTHKVWGLVEGVKVETNDQGETVRTLSEASIKTINPQHVVNWWPSTGPLEQVVVKETKDTRQDIRDTEGKHETEIFTLYEMDGWTRFKVTEGDTPQVMDTGQYQYWADPDRSRKVLPIFFVELPMPRPIGYLLSKKQEHIYNMTSRRDFGVSILSFAVLRLIADKKQYNDLINDIEKGYNIIRQDPQATGEHGYMSPDSSYLGDYGQILEKKKEDFYDAAFKAYGDAAKQVTATEIRLESQSGIEAFLSLLVTSIDEFEQHCLWRLMQVYFPDTPSAWGSASVERSDDFKPKDIEESLKKISGAVLDLDRAGAISTFQKVKQAHPDWTEEEVEEEVQRILQENGAVPPEMNGD